MNDNKYFAGAIFLAFSGLIFAGSVHHATGWDNFPDYISAFANCAMAAAAITAAGVWRRQILYERKANLAEEILEEAEGLVGAIRFAMNSLILEHEKKAADERFEGQDHISTEVRIGWTRLTDRDQHRTALIAKRGKTRRTFGPEAEKKVEAICAFAQQLLTDYHTHVSLSQRLENTPRTSEDRRAELQERIWKVEDRILGLDPEHIKDLETRFDGLEAELAQHLK